MKFSMLGRSDGFAGVKKMAASGDVGFVTVTRAAVHKLLSSGHFQGCFSGF